jgi:hypothetical protein
VLADRHLKDLCYCVLIKNGVEKIHVPCTRASQDLGSLESVPEGAELCVSASSSSSCNMLAVLLGACTLLLKIPRLFAPDNREANLRIHMSGSGR